MKSCRTCRKDKPLTAYDRNRPGGTLRSECLACRSDKRRRREGCKTRAELRAGKIAREITNPRRPRAECRFLPLIAQLLAEDPTATALSFTSQRYRARYRYDQEFRAKEISRRQNTFYELDDDGTLSPPVIAGLFAAASMCPYCKRPMSSSQKSLDHITPRSRGGAHSIANVIVCCRSCNSRKRNRIVTEFIRDIRRAV